jgi:long-subunit fatty acid transport protein
MNRAHAAIAVAFAGTILGAASTFFAPPAAAADPADYRNAEDFSSEALYATGVVGVGARAMGLAGNYTAISDDATALVYNPAGLAQLLRIEVDLGLHHLRDENTSRMFDASTRAAAERTGIDHAAFAYPIPTYRGSLVAGFGVFRARSNDLAEARRDQRSGAGYDFNDEFRRAQRDGVWRFTGGLGLDLLRSLSFGASVSYWEGQLRDDQYRRIDETVIAQPPLRYVDRLVSESDLNGFSFDLGLMGYVARRARLGLVLHSPIWYDISGSGEFVRTATAGAQDETQLLYIDQRPSVPWSLGCGGSLGFGPVLLAGDLRFAAWDEIDLDTGAFTSGASLPLESPGYSSTVGGGIGLEIEVPHSPLRLRGGFSYDPEPYDLLLGNPSAMVHDRRTWTAGGGLQLADAFVLDAGFVAGSFERADRDFAAVSEKRSEHRFYLTAGYRY